MLFGWVLWLNTMMKSWNDVLLHSVNCNIHLCFCWIWLFNGVLANCKTIILLQLFNFSPHQSPTTSNQLTISQFTLCSSFEVQQVFSHSLNMPHTVQFFHIYFAINMFNRIECLTVAIAYHPLIPEVVAFDWPTPQDNSSFSLHSWRTTSQVNITLMF